MKKIYLPDNYCHFYNVMIPAIHIMFPSNKRSCLNVYCGIGGSVVNG